MGDWWCWEKVTKEYQEKRVDKLEEEIEKLKNESKSIALDDSLLIAQKDDEIRELKEKYLEAVDKCYELNSRIHNAKEYIYDTPKVKKIFWDVKRNKEDDQRVIAFLEKTFKNELNHILEGVEE